MDDIIYSHEILRLMKEYDQYLDDRDYSEIREELKILESSLALEDVYPQSFKISRLERKIDKEIEIVDIGEGLVVNRNIYTIKAKEIYEYKAELDDIKRNEINIVDNYLSDILSQEDKQGYCFGFEIMFSYYLEMLYTSFKNLGKQEEYILVKTEMNKAIEVREKRNR